MIRPFTHQRALLALYSCCLLAGCATNTETTPTPPERFANPASDSDREIAPEFNAPTPANGVRAEVDGTAADLAERAPETEEEKLFHKVVTRLLDTEVVKDNYPSKYRWPPHFFIKPNSAKEKNAFASAAMVHGATFHQATGKIRPAVMITEGYLNDVVKGDEHMLAAVMGHELAHLLKDHVGGRKGETALLVLAFSRDQEFEADLDGMQAALAAGYPYKDVVAAVIREMKNNPNLTSFEGLHSTHPTWEERLAHLDRNQSLLWKAMSAFRNGFLFLDLEQYSAAEHCFQAVVREFPDCHEAWANLGYTKLMRYIDALETDDLRNYNIGQIVGGGFYVRAESLNSKVRAIDERLWRDAVRALKRALEQNPSLAMVHANLGVASLVDPAGSDAQLAGKYFKDAMGCFERDPELKSNAVAIASLLVNAGVADLASGKTAETAGKFNAASKLISQFEGAPLVESLKIGLLYNQALLNEKSGATEDKRRALTLYETYLLQASTDGAWWPLARERYAALGKELGVAIRDEGALQRRARPASFRLVTSLKVGSDTITLSEPTSEAVGRLGKKAAQEQPLFAGSTIARWRYAERGVELLGNERILAIFLTNNENPIFLQATGLGARIQELRIGMSEDELLEVLKHERWKVSLRHIADSDVRYRFYSRLGLGVRVADRRVQEMVITQLPGKAADGW